MAIGPYQAVDCSAISEVPRIDGLNDLNDNRTLILVSVPYNGIDDDHSTSEDYISKSATLGELSEHLRDSLELYHIYEMLDEKVDLSTLNYSATLCADTVNPYILSSLTIKDGKFDHADGYRLSAGIDQVFANDRAAGNKLRTRIMDSWTGNQALSNRFMYTIAYDHEYNRIDIHNTNNSSHSYIYRDDMLSDWFDDIKRYNILSNVTMSRDGTKLYLHFVLSSGNDPSRPSLKKVTIDFKHVFPYEYLSSQGGLSVMYPGVDAEGEALGKLSVMVDTNVISTKKYVNDQDYALSGLLSTYTNTKINELCGYVDTQDTKTLNLSKTYTNQQINSLSSYVNQQLTTINNSITDINTRLSNIEQRLTQGYYIEVEQ